MTFCEFACRFLRLLVEAEGTVGMGAGEASDRRAALRAVSAANQRGASRRSLAPVPPRGHALPRRRWDCRAKSRRRRNRHP